MDVEYVLCPFCGQNMQLYAKTTDLQSNICPEYYYAYECTNCNILLQYPFWKLEDTRRFYPKNYYAHNNETKLSRNLKLLNYYFKNSLLSRLLSSFRHILFPYFSIIQNSKVVLDIGCGKCLFLDIMKAQGKSTYGVEPSDNAKSIAAKKGHEIIEFPDFASCQQKFDLITMFQVAEHLSVSEIIEQNYFQKLNDLLIEGGYLIIETPNYACSLSNTFRSAWRALELPRHLVIYSPKSIKKILTDHGFSVKIYTRMSPVDVRQSIKLKYREYKYAIVNSGLKFFKICVLIIHYRMNDSLLTVVARKEKTL